MSSSSGSKRARLSEKGYAWRFERIVDLCQARKQPEFSGHHLGSDEFLLGTIWEHEGELEGEGPWRAIRALKNQRVRFGLSRSRLSEATAAPIRRIEASDRTC